MILFIDNICYVKLEERFFLCVLRTTCLLKGLNAGSIAPLMNRWVPPWLEV